MMKMRVRRVRWWSVLSILCVLVMAFPGDAFAQRRGGGGSRGSRPKTSRPKTKAAKPSRGKSSGKASKKKGAYGSDKKAGKSKAQKKVDRDLYAKAKANGTTFKDRKSASADFKKKNAAKYGSTYASKPATRPGHIPQTTMVGGTQTTIIYNQGHGGYGYMNVMGTWMMYNAMSDIAMAPYYNRQMASAGYYYGAPPRSGIGIGAGTILLVIVAVGVIVFLVFSRRGGATSKSIGD